MDYNKIEKRIEEYVTGLFEEKHIPALVFHNLDHTRTVVKRAKEIASHYDLSEKDNFILVTAAWFHDTGYLFAEPSRHENVSCDVVKNFMHEHVSDEATVAEIMACVMATKFPTSPKTLLQEIICDADTYQLGTKEFKQSNRKVWEELRMRNQEIDLQKFNEGTIKFLEKHQYYTSYCKELLNEGKRKNIKKLRKKLKAEIKETNLEEAAAAPEISGNLADVKKDKSGLMGKGIQTMLRLTSQNHLKLSEMADHKANILISVNSIIISVILSVLLRKLSEDTYLIIPTIIFLIVAVITIVIAILSTRPKINEGSFTMKEVTEKKINLLFFGNFYKASYEEYNEAMKSMMLDTDYLYGSLIKDIYYLGVVLGRKYKLIRLAYNIFMIGIIISVVAFAIAAFFYDSSASGTVINGTGSPL
jgi:predicted metal-dependent HD superfamily phosphohydrolase